MAGSEQKRLKQCQLQKFSKICWPSIQWEKRCHSNLYSNIASIHKNQLLTTYIKNKKLFHFLVEYWKKIVLLNVLDVQVNNCCHAVLGSQSFASNFYQSLSTNFSVIFFFFNFKSLCVGWKESLTQITLNWSTLWKGRQFFGLNAYWKYYEYYATIWMCTLFSRVMEEIVEIKIKVESQILINHIIWKSITWFLKPTNHPLLNIYNNPVLIASPKSTLCTIFSPILHHSAFSQK